MLTLAGLVRIYNCIYFSYIYSLVKNFFYKLKEVDVHNIYQATKQTIIYYIFRMIFESQICNKKCIEGLIQFIISSLLELKYSSKKDTDLKRLRADDEEQKKSNDKAEQNVLINEDNSKELFIFEEEKEVDPKLVEIQQRYLKDILNKLMEEIKRILQSSEKQAAKKEGLMFSDEIFWLLSEIRRTLMKQYLSKKEAEEDGGKVSNNLNDKIQEKKISSLIVFLLLEELSNTLSKKMEYISIPSLKKKSEDNKKLTEFEKNMLGVLYETNKNDNNESDTKFKLIPKSNLKGIGDLLGMCLTQEEFSKNYTETNKYFKTEALDKIHEIAECIESVHF